MMFADPGFMCIDAGGENCPCSLAKSGNCIVCGRLSGGDCSGCRWHGVCIYNEYIQGGRQVKNNRKDKEFNIIEKERYGDTLLLGIEVGKGFALKCYPCGTYVFLRTKEREQFFNVPISVMRTDVEKGSIYILVKCISAKTKELLKAEESVIVRGPYRNGVLGIDDLRRNLVKLSKNNIRGKILIVSRSAGIAPAAKLIQELGKEHYVSLFADTSNLHGSLMKKHFKEQPEFLREIDLTNENNMFEIWEEIAFGGYDGLAVFASDYYISRIGDISERLGFKGTVAVSNNFNLCCGEGICGACSVAGKQGETLKMCKCRLSGNEILKRKVIYE